MGVFSPNTTYDLQMQVKRLAERFFATRPLVFTDAEFIEGFIQAEHIEILKQTEDMCGLIGNTGSTSFEAKTTSNVPINLILLFRGNSPIIMPHYINKGLQKDAPEELRERLQAWVDERFLYGCVFGDVYDAVERLNVVCAEAKAMNVLLPILPTLLRNITVEADSRTSKRARKLSEMRGVSSMPVLPRTVTTRIQECCHLLTAANMIDSVPDVKLESGWSQTKYFEGLSQPLRPSIFAGICGESKAKKGTFL